MCVTYRRQKEKQWRIDWISENRYTKSSGSVNITIRDGVEAHIKKIQTSIHTCPLAQHAKWSSRFSFCAVQSLTLIQWILWLLIFVSFALPVTNHKGIHETRQWKKKCRMWSLWCCNPPTWLIFKHQARSLKYLSLNCICSISQSHIRAKVKPAYVKVLYWASTALLDFLSGCRSPTYVRLKAFAAVWK